MIFNTINPATGKNIQEYKEFSDDDIEKILKASHLAFKQWSKLAFSVRAQHMQSLADNLLKQKRQLAEVITQEMGKPLTAAIAEIEKCALVCRHYAEQAENYLAPRIIQTEMQKSYVSYHPIGTVFNIMPWNFPFWQVFRFAAPNLMAGNTAILRHAPVTTGCGLLIEKIFIAAGFPENVFRTVIVSNEQAAKIITHPNIAGVTLTGSERAGRIVGAEAAGALKKVVLELGGSDPYLILEDADLDLAAESCVKSRLTNSGQVCVSAKRLIAVEKVYEQFKEKVLKLASQYKMGDPMDPSTQMGPMARADLREQLQRQLDESVALGAKVLLGGKIVPGEGYYYPATVIENIPKNSPAYCDELFGPVICLFKAKDETEAILIANDTRFGLGAGVFTKDISRGEKIARDKLEAGSCVVNTTVTSDPRLPFGGVKGSGYGRELSAEGIKEFVNIKTVVVCS